MSDIRASLEQYLTTRRRLGYELKTAGRILERFVAFAESQGTDRITIDLVQRWMSTPSRAHAATWGSRVGAVRGLARWLSATDSRTEIPPEGLIPHQPRRRRPHIYSKTEIQEILRGAARLKSARGLRGPTYATLFGLVTVTGMRISEAIALDCTDVDLREGLLVIRRTKFGKSRLVPLHSTAAVELQLYAERRDRTLGGTPAAFFVSEQGCRVTEWSARYNFARVCQSVGVRAVAAGFKHGRGPRIHDLRHRFAVETLLRWYRSDAEPEREIDKLSTYLGHVHSRDTYWYVEAVPELLQLATERVIARRTAEEAP